MAITSISQYMAGPRAGDLHGADYSARSYTNNVAGAAKVVDITITAANSTEYTVTIDGVPISITSDGSATTQEIRDALIAAIIASAFTDPKVVPSSGGAAVLRLTERAPEGGEVTIAVGANLAAAVYTAHAEEESIPVGICVAKVGTDDKSCGLPRGTGAKLLGVVPFQHQGVGIDPTADAWPPNSMVPVVHDGDIFVTVEDAVDAEDAAYVRVVATASFPQLGGFRSDADTANAIALTGAKFKTSADAGGVARLAIKIP